MRFQAAGDIRLEIDDYLASSDERNVGPRSSARSILQPWPWAVAGLLVAGLVLALWRPWFASAPAALPMRLDIRVADGEPLIFDENRDSALAMISPDGQSLVYRGTRDGIGRLYVRSLNSGQSRPLAGTEGALAHFFSPDGRWVAFFASGMLNKVALTGGAPMQLCSAPRGKGGAWSDDDTIVFTPDTDTGLFLVSAAGGSPVQVTKPADGERTHRWPTFLPGGKAVVFMRQNKDAAYDDGLIEAVRLDTGERKVLVRGGTFPRYLASGHLAYMREGTLFVVPMNPDRLELQGGAVPVLAEILSSGGVGSVSGDGAGQISFSTNGTAVYVPGSWSGAAAALEIVDRTGKTIYTYHEPHDFRSPRFSPDGTRIAVLMGDANGRHVHVVDPARGTASRVTFDGTDNGVPVWTPDGKRLAYWSDRASSTGNIFLTRSDGSGEPERLTSAPYVQVPSSFSSDGHLLAGMEAVTATSMQLAVTATRMQLFVLSTADGQVKSLIGRGSIELLPVFSPDNRWIAYTSNESSTSEIYVRPYPGPGGKWRVSTAGGFIPRWTRGGREIVYVDPRPPARVMAVDISVDGDELKPGAPTVLFEASIAQPPAATWYDASADGTRFVILKTSANVPPEGFTHATLALNFFDEVRRATAAKR